MEEYIFRFISFIERDLVCLIDTILQAISPQPYALQYHCSVQQYRNT